MLYYPYPLTVALTVSGIFHNTRTAPLSAELTRLA
jgi:hypothetical protein